MIRSRFHLRLLALCALACSCTVFGSEPPSRITVVSDRPAHVFVMEPRGMMRDRGVVDAGEEFETDVGIAAPAGMEWPVLLLTPSRDSMAVVGCQPDHRCEVASSEWEELNAEERTHVDLALRGETAVGMQRALLILAWGLPARVVSRAASHLGISEIWSYERDGRDVLVYIVDGAIESVRTL